MINGHENETELTEKLSELENILNNDNITIEERYEQNLNLNKLLSTVLYAENLDKDSLVLSSSDVKDPMGQSFKMFKLSDFELFVNKTEHLVKYLEYEPDSLIFRHKEEKHLCETQ